MTATFPQAPLDLRYELLINGTWTDISTYVYQRDDQVITRGHPDESTTAQPSQLTATWNNRTGRFSSKNPLGAYYPYFGRNTPVRVSVPAQANYLRIEADQVSYTQTPDSPGLSITGDMDVQLDVTLDNWRQDQMLAAKWADTGNERSWVFYLQAGKLFFGFSSSGTGSDNTNSSEFGGNGTVPVPPLRRQCLRVTFAASTGTVKFYTSPAPLSSAVWTQLGDTSAFGSSSIFNSTAPVQAGYATDAASIGVGGIYGQVHELAILSGIGGTTKGDANFALATAGTSTYTDPQGNVWTAEGTSEISGRNYRGHFELSACPQAWDPTGGDVYCQIQASGILRRLAQNTQTLGSVFFRAFTEVDPPNDLIGYWSCEDGNATSSGSLPATPTQFAPGLPGLAAGTFTGTPQFASDNSFLCSQAIPVMSGSRWHFRLPARSGADSANIFRFLLDMPAASDTNNGVIARMATSGTIARLDLVYSTGGGLILNGYDSSLSSLFSIGPDSFGTDGTPMWVSMELQKSGSSVQYSVVTLLPGAVSGNAMTGTLSSASIGNATQFTINATGAAVLQGSALGQITYQGKWETLFDFASQLDAYQGEAAGQRFARLCGEQGIPFRPVGSLDDTVLMGAQTPLAFTDLLQECADADRGQIYEPREALALGYRTRRSLENQQAGITLDYTAAVLADPVQETEDDQYTINDETVTRAYGLGGGTGSSYEAVLQAGPLSVQDPPAGVGEYPNADTVNLFTDAQLSDQAWWIVSLGTVDEPRYPQIMVNLARPEITGSSALFYGVPLLDLGDRLAVTDTPAWLPPDGITQLAIASTETLNAFVWTIAWCCVPEQPYEVASADDPVYARADSPDSTLHTTITSSATSMSVSAGASGELGTTSGGDFPFDVELGGERITVGAVSGSSSPQTFSSLTRSVNGVVKAQTAGAAVSLFFPSIAAL